MARIRSIHPGQWTDEAFVSVGFEARLLAIGLRNEADDRGVFPWSPINLKMRLFPADNVNVDDLLGQLERVGIVQRFTDDDKLFGAIRNFLKWQSPKYPSYAHPFPENLRLYVGLSPNEDGFNSSNSRNGESSTPKVGGKSGQRERRGEERRGEGTTTKAVVVSPPSGGDPPAADRGPTIPLEAAAALWNELCGQALGSVAKLTDLRRKHLRARMVEHWPQDPLGGWRAYCRRIMGSDFLTGRKGSTGAHAGWKADFDWALNASNTVKVVEGRYDNDRDRAPPPPTDGRFIPAPGTV